MSCLHPAPWIHAYTFRHGRRWGIAWCRRCGRRDVLVPLDDAAAD